jgi:pimeloyl-ACP methyl ester carboxylesterase
MDMGMNTGMNREASTEPETVFLLHGLARSSFSMFMLERRLKRAGFRVRSKGYGSTQANISQHVAWLEEVLRREDLSRPQALHFVTHSLGGIILRKYLQDRTVANLGRVVMLAPPNQGSEIVDQLRDWPLFRYVMGPSGQELGTDPQSVPQTLRKVDFELGVITGDASASVLGAMFLPSPHDGTVSVEGAKVDGMKDFLVVSHTHSFIMNSTSVANQVAIFLRTGKFSAPEE